MGNGSIQGGIHLQLQTYSYFPGEQVVGSIYVQLAEFLPNAKLSLILKGREKTHWSETRTRSVDNGDGTTRTETYTVYFSGKKKITNFTTTIYEWPQGLQPTDFKSDFTLFLPPSAPGSFMFSGHSSKSSIKYKLKAKIVSRDGSKRKKTFKTPIMIKQAHREAVIHTNLVQKKSANLKVCCCSRGTTGVKAYFPKDFYGANEVPLTMIEIDNKESKMDVKNIEACLWRTITLHDDHGNTKTIKTKIISAVAPGIKSGDAILENNVLNLQLDLPSVRHTIETTFTCIGNIINCSYQVEAGANMDGCCMCCGDKPNVFCSMILVPDYYPDPPMPPPPTGWNPQMYEPVHINYDQRYEVEPSAPPMD